MAKKTAQKKPRNPNDATFRNITALKARVRELEGQQRRTWLMIISMGRTVTQLEKRR